MRKTAIGVVLVLILLLVASYAETADINSDDFVSGLEIPEMNTSLGSDGENTDKQIFNYTITLINTNEYEVAIKWVEPVLTNEMKERVLAEDLKVPVNKAIAPGGLVIISGQFSFDAEGTTKEQILSWEPILKAIHVVSEASLPLPGITVR